MTSELEAVEYKAGPVTMTGYLAGGASGSRVPGVLVAHEAPGLDDHMRSRAQALAERGYVAFALDLYGEPFSVEQAMTRHANVMDTPGLILDRATAALDVLRTYPAVDAGRLAAIGFCQGGIVALELARAGAPIRAAVGFHPGLKRPAGSPDGPIAAKVLMMVGNDDPVVPLEDRAAFAAEMDAKGVDWQLHTFGRVGHTFTNPAVDALGMPGFRYDAAANQRAWAMALGLLREVFEEPAGA